MIRRRVNKDIFYTHIAFSFIGNLLKIITLIRTV